MQIGFWDESLRLEKLSQLGDCLVRLNKVIDWEIFRPTITRVVVIGFNQQSTRPWLPL